MAEIDYRVNCVIALFQGHWEHALELENMASKTVIGFAGFGARETVEALTVSEPVALHALIEGLRSLPPEQLFDAGIHAEYSTLIAELGRRLEDDKALSVARQVALSTIHSDNHAGSALETAELTVAILATASGNPSAAAKQYAALRDQGGLLPVYARAICPDRLLALLSVAMNDIEAAARHFSDAIALCEKANYLPELAFSCADYAETLITHGSRDDRDRIIDLVGRGLTICDQLYMEPLRRRLSKALDRAEAIPVEPEPYPAGLTRREVEVLRLLAAGRSNREIGDELVITHNTVITHVRHILEKTDSANRSEAGAFAHRYELADP
ncbi:MAG: LuxR C-terminal-related transcriptional regulator [Chloroflexi bacterium]|nr:LuxR C-terminal-related transcriptional regulator [Chloroflexota bacterium]